MMKLFRRKDSQSWEVVNSCSVDPIPSYYEEDDLDLIAVKEGNVRRRYVLEMKDEARRRNELQQAVVFARDQLLQEVVKNGYNTLLHESWSLTLLRKAKAQRIEIEYSGRPARTLSQVSHRVPPFMAILQAQN